MGREKKIAAERETLKKAETIDACKKPDIPSFEENENYIFISYSHDDFQEVYSDLIFLYHNGVRYWYDKGLPCGENWENVVKEHLDNPHCGGVVFYLSQPFFESESISKEIMTVIEKGKPYICVNLTKKPPQDLIVDAAKEIVAQDRNGQIDVLKEKFSNDITYLGHDVCQYDENLITEIKKFNVIGKIKTAHKKEFFEFAHYLTLDAVKGLNPVTKNTLDQKYSNYQWTLPELVDEGIAREESDGRVRVLWNTQEWLKFLYEEYESKKNSEEDAPEDLAAYNDYLCDVLLPSIKNFEGMTVWHTQYGEGHIRKADDKGLAEIAFGEDKQDEMEIKKIHLTTVICNHSLKLSFEKIIPLFAYDGEAERQKVNANSSEGLKGNWESNKIEPDIFEIENTKDFEKIDSRNLLSDVEDALDLLIEHYCELDTIDCNDFVLVSYCEKSLCGLSYPAFFSFNKAIIDNYYEAFDSMFFKLYTQYINSNDEHWLHIMKTMIAGYGGKSYMGALLGIGGSDDEFFAYYGRKAKGILNEEEKQRKIARWELDMCDTLFAFWYMRYRIREDEKSLQKLKMLFNDYGKSFSAFFDVEYSFAAFLEHYRKLQKDSPSKVFAYYYLLYKKHSNEFLYGEKQPLYHRMKTIYEKHSAHICDALHVQDIYFFEDFMKKYDKKK